MNVRKKHFTKEFMKENFEKIHKEETNENLPGLGYPDMGNGRFTEKLSYRGWWELNNSIRIHQNFVEQIGNIYCNLLGIMIPITLIAGLKFSKISACLGGSYFLGRILYTWGYKKNPNKREAGGVILNLSLIANALLALATGFKICKLA